MKHTIIILALLLAACGAKDIPSLKADPAIHRAVVAQGDYKTVYERIRSKILECREMANANAPHFENSERRLIESFVGNYDGTAFYYSVQGNENGTSTVDIYSHFTCLHWPRVVETVAMGALGQECCP